MLPMAERLFAGLALGAGGLLVVLLLASLIGTDADVEAEVDVDGGILTLKGILAFVSFFGFGAWAITSFGGPRWLAILTGIGTGYAMMSTVALLIARLRRLDTDGGRQSEQLLNQLAEVYLRIPASGQGSGRVQVKQGNRLVEIEAYTKGPSLASGDQARVVQVRDDGSVLVEAINRVGVKQRTHGYVE